MMASPPPPPPTRRTTRSTANAAPPLMPPTPPTTGPSRIKRARPAVEEDVSDTPVKNNKGRPEIENLGE
ncbi:hypothetical protein Q7P36_009021 [Cladosporium allicinum]